MTQGYPVPPGPSIIESLWSELGRQVGKLISLREDPERGPLDQMDSIRGQEGHCLGLAKALAIILNPYNPDIDEVRREAMRRYREGAES